MNYKLTIDRNLGTENSTQSMDKLRAWMKEGKIQFVEAHTLQQTNASYNWPGLPPRGPDRGPSKYKPKPKGSSTFREIASILFPARDSQKLAMGEVNEVAHLVQHIDSKNEFFITLNTKSFINDGKRERLKRSFGVIAMTPDEVVATLSQIEGWK